MLRLINLFRFTREVTLMLKTDIKPKDVDSRSVESKEVNYSGFQVYCDIDGTMYDHNVNQALGEALQYFGISSINAHSNMGKTSTVDITSRICGIGKTRPEIFAEFEQYGVAIDRVVTKWDLAYPMTDEDHKHGRLGIGYQRLFMPLFNLAFPNGIDDEGAMKTREQYERHETYIKLAQTVVKITNKADQRKAGYKTVKGAMLEMVVNELFPEQTTQLDDIVVDGNTNQSVKRLLFLEDSDRDAIDMREAAEKNSAKVEIGVVRVKNDDRQWLNKEELISAFIEALVKDPYEKQVVDLLRLIKNTDLSGMTNAEMAGGWQYQKHLTQKQKFASLDEIKQNLPDFRRRIDRAICKLVIMTLKNGETRDLDILNGVYEELKSLKLIGDKSPAFARTILANTMNKLITNVTQLYENISEAKYSSKEKSEAPSSLCT